MSHNKAALSHSNGYSAQAACEHCEGIIRHERWYQTFNPVVSYAYRIVVSAERIGDRRRDYRPLARRSVGPLPHLNSMLRLALNRLSLRVSRAIRKPALPRLRTLPVRQRV